MRVTLVTRRSRLKSSIMMTTPCRRPMFQLTQLCLLLCGVSTAAAELTATDVIHEAEVSSEDFFDDRFDSDSSENDNENDNRIQSKWVVSQAFASTATTAGDEVDKSRTAGFGASVRLGANGSTFAVGSPLENQVTVYREQSSLDSEATWFAYQINSKEQQDERFGDHIAMSASGQAIAVGSYLHSVQHDGLESSPAIGRVCLYAWNEEEASSAGYAKFAQDVVGETAFEHLGWSVAVAEVDGEITVASGNLAGGEVLPGQVKTYHATRQGSLLEPQTKLLQEDEGEMFGFSLAASANGKVLAVGASEFSDDSGSPVGRVQVYQRNGEQALEKMSGSLLGAGPEHFGTRLAIAADGQTLASCGYIIQDGDVAAVIARVYDFREINGYWVQRGEDLVVPNAQVGTYGAGISMALSGDGQTLALRAVQIANDDTMPLVQLYTWHVPPERSDDDEDENEEEEEAAWVLQQELTEQTSLVGSLVVNDIHFGWDLTLSHDGGVLGMGAIAVYDNDQGYAFLFEREEVAPSPPSQVHDAYLTEQDVHILSEEQQDQYERELQQTEMPSDQPSSVPVADLTGAPSAIPTIITDIPTAVPTDQPTAPTAAPSDTAKPTATAAPTKKFSPTAAPYPVPTDGPNNILTLPPTGACGNEGEPCCSFQCNDGLACFFTPDFLQTECSTCGPFEQAQCNEFIPCCTGVGLQLTCDFDTSRCVTCSNFGQPCSASTLCCDGYACSDSTGGPGVCIFATGAPSKQPESCVETGFPCSSLSTCCQPEDVCVIPDGQTVGVCGIPTPAPSKAPTRCSPPGNICFDPTNCCVADAECTDIDLNTQLGTCSSGSCVPPLGVCTAATDCCIAGSSCINVDPTSPGTLVCVSPATAAPTLFPTDTSRPSAGPSVTPARTPSAAPVLTASPTVEGCITTGATCDTSIGDVCCQVNSGVSCIVTTPGSTIGTCEGTPTSTPTAAPSFLPTTTFPTPEGCVATGGTCDTSINQVCCASPVGVTCQVAPGGGTVGICAGTPTVEPSAPPTTPPVTSFPTVFGCKATGATCDPGAGDVCCQQSAGVSCIITIPGSTTGTCLGTPTVSPTALSASPTIRPTSSTRDPTSSPSASPTSSTCTPVDAMCQMNGDCCTGYCGGPMGENKVCKRCGGPNDNCDSAARCCQPGNPFVPTAVEQSCVIKMGSGQCKDCYVVGDSCDAGTDCCSGLTCAMGGKMMCTAPKPTAIPTKSPRPTTAKPTTTTCTMLNVRCGMNADCCTEYCAGPMGKNKICKRCGGPNDNCDSAARCCQPGPGSSALVEQVCVIKKGRGQCKDCISVGNSCKGSDCCNGLTCASGPKMICTRPANAPSARPTITSRPTTARPTTTGCTMIAQPCSVDNQCCTQLCAGPMGRNKICKRCGTTNDNCVSTSTCCQPAPGSGSRPNVCVDSASKGKQCRECIVKGDSCGSTNECCTGLTCSSGAGMMCTQPAPPPPCTSQGNSCGATSDCCNGLTCSASKMMICTRPANAPSVSPTNTFRPTTPKPTTSTCTALSLSCSGNADCCTEYCAGPMGNNKICKRCGTANDNCALRKDCCQAALGSGTPEQACVQVMGDGQCRDCLKQGDSCTGTEDCCLGLSCPMGNNMMMMCTAPKPTTPKPTITARPTKTFQPTFKPTITTRPTSSQPTGSSCLFVNNGCVMNADCCTGYCGGPMGNNKVCKRCGTANDNCDSAARCCQPAAGSGIPEQACILVKGMGQCRNCISVGSSCDADTDCCSTLTCTKVAKMMLCSQPSGACTPQGSSCNGTPDCCSGLTCSNDPTMTCTQPARTSSSCTAESQSCTPGDGACCSGLLCAGRMSSAASCKTCAVTFDNCSMNSDCCGNKSRCIGNACCKSGGPCNGNVECCSGVCNNSMCITAARKKRIRQRQRQRQRNRQTI